VARSVAEIEAGAAERAAARVVRYDARAERAADRSQAAGERPGTPEADQKCKASGYLVFSRGGAARCRVRYTVARPMVNSSVME
jgi:hypothetical protein